MSFVIQSDIQSARAELAALLSKPLANGMLPHMIYWDKNYQTIKWGREHEGDTLSEAWGVSGMSSITQPPLIATALWHLHTRAPDVGYLRDAYPKLREHYLSLTRERSIEAHGLLGIINPDESGEDNSPRFDRIQGLPHHHTPEENLHRRIALVREHAACKFDVQNCTRKYFWVEDVSFNAIAIRAFESLALIAREVGETVDAGVFEFTAHQLTISMNRFMSSGCCFFSLEGEARKPILTETWGLFMPLYAGVLNAEGARLLIEQYLLNQHKFFTSYPIPSVAISDPSYSENDLWRGPTWIATNWFIYSE